MVSVLAVEAREWMLRYKPNLFTGKQLNLQMPRGVEPIDGVSGLAAGIVADFDVTLVELHRDVIVVSVVQEDAIIFSRGHLQRDTEGNKWEDEGM